MGEKADEAKGRAKKATGEVTGDRKLKDQGRIDKASSKAKKGVGKAADKAKRGVRRA
jgi:uncharacterized protein YjbJ (UPF0337 family)